MTNSSLLKMAIEIVDFPMNSMVIFHYQRVEIIIEPILNQVPAIRSYLSGKVGNFINQVAEPLKVQKKLSSPDKNGSQIWPLH